MTTSSDLGISTLSGSVSSAADLIASTKIVGYKTASIQITGTWVGTITFYGSNDNSNFEPVYALPIGTPNKGRASATTPYNGIFHLPLNFEYLKVTMTSYTSGTANAVVVIYEEALTDPIGPTYADVQDNNGTPIEIALTGDLKASSPVKLVGEIFESTSLDANVWSSTLVGTGSISVSNAAALLQTGTTANSSAFLASLHKGRFLPGTTNAFRCIARLGDTGTANNLRRWGAYDANNGVYFQLNGSTFAVGVRYAGADTVITSFSGNNPTVDTNYHRYEIQFSEGRAYFYQDGALIHAFAATTTTLVASPSLKIGAENTNSGGGTTNTSLYLANIAIMRYGEIEARPRFFHSNFVGRVQSASANTAANANSQAVTLSATTAGNCLIVAVSISANAISSITDNMGQTWTQASSIADGGGGFSYIYYVPNTVAGVTTITVTLGALVTDSIHIIAAEYFGVNASTPLDKTSTQTNSGTTALNSGSTATTSQSTELLFGTHYTTQSASDAITPGTGWAAIATIGSQGHQLYAQDQIAINTGAYASTATAAAAHNFYSSIATFKMTIPASALTTNLAQVLKTGPGTLKRLIINTGGTGTASIVFYDGTSTSGTEIATVELTQTPQTLDFDLDFDSGLAIVVNSTTPDFTVIYD